LTFLVSTGPRALGQQQSAQTPPPKPAQAKSSVLGDYVPCLFDDGQQYELRALQNPNEQPLDQAQAAKAASAAKDSLNSVAPAGSEGDSLRSLATAIDASDFQGKKPSDASTVVLAKASKIEADPGKVASAATAAQNAVSPQTFERPPDVSCSFSIMQWKETSDTFGRRVANQYVAIEVNVRNLNDQYDFLIHDVQIAVDTGLTPAQFGRFKASRDKLIVRDIAQRGQTSDRRNLVINSLQMAGAIAGGASAAVTQSLTSTVVANDFSTSVAIFQGPFITGLINIFPDHTIEHINHLNDLAFSASSTNKTVVPVQGSVPLVTFLSEKPLEQLPFAQCGRSGHQDQDDPICSVESLASQGSKSVGGPPQNGSEASGGSGSNTYYPSSISFKSWNALALAVLERRVFVVIAGVHIKEVAKEPTFTSITCAPGNDSTIALGKITESKSATCTLKGTDLDLISKVQLQNATDSSDKTQIEGSSSVSGDTTQATVQFNTNDLAGLKGTSYALYYSLKDGSSQKSSLTVTVQQAVSLSPASLSFAPADKDKAQIVTLTNNGTATLTINGVTPMGDKKADFTASACAAVPVKVDAGKPCKISVTLTKVSGAGNASLSIDDDGQGNPHAVPITETK
jgi:hypothetical protein